MNLTQFLANYYCRVHIPTQITKEYAITTELKSIATDDTIDRVQTIFDYFDIAGNIATGHSLNALNSFEWDKIIDNTKRSHLDYFALRMPIDNYYPLNSNIDISNMYR